MAKADLYVKGMARLVHFYALMIMQRRFVEKRSWMPRLIEHDAVKKRRNTEFWKQTLISSPYDTLSSLQQYITRVFLEKGKINTDVVNPSVFPRFQVEKLFDLRGVRWLDVLWFHVAACQEKLLKVLHVLTVPLRGCFVVDHRGWIILPNDALCLLLNLKLKKFRCG